MDLYIYTKAPSPAQAIATSLADLASLITALSDPLDSDNQETLARIAQTVDQIVLNDNEPLTLRFYDDSSTLSSWAADSSYGVVVAMGSLASDGTGVLTSCTADTIAAGVRTGTLDLTTQALRGHVQANRDCGNGCWVPLQIRRTDASGNRLTYVQQRFRVPLSVLAAAITSPDPQDSYLTAAEIAAAYEAKSSAYKHIPQPFFGNAVDEQEFGFFYAEVATRIVGMLITAQNAPTGADLTVDLTKAGVEQSKVGTLTAGSNYQRSAFASPLDLAAGENVRLKIKTIGSSHPGGWPVVTLITRSNY